MPKKLAELTLQKKVEENIACHLIDNLEYFFIIFSVFNIMSTSVVSNFLSTIEP